MRQYVPNSYECVFLSLFSLYEHICDNLQRFEVLGCPKTLKQYGLQCHCPFKSGEFQVRNLPLNIPKIHGFARAFIRVRVSQVIYFFLSVIGARTFVRLSPPVHNLGLLMVNTRRYILRGGNSAKLLLTPSEKVVYSKRKEFVPKWGEILSF